MVVLLGIVSFWAFANSEQVVAPTPIVQNLDACAIDNTAFQDGEELVYKVYYNWNFIWVSAAEVTFRVRDYGGNYHITADGRTYKSYDWAFKVRDYYECDIDKNSLLPEHSVRSVREGGYRLYDEMDFDQDDKKVVSKRGKTKNDTRQQTFEIENCVHDMLSIIYYIRNVEFSQFRKGDVLPFEIFMDKKVWPLQLKYAGKETGKKVKGIGTFNTNKFNPQLITGGVFKEGDEMTVWASDDKNNIPVMIESPVSVGSVKVVLKSYKGLKYPLSSKIK